MVQIGGNKRFYDFLREYGKERDPIGKKYSSTPAQYYRRMLCAQAKNKPFKEEAPAKSAADFANKTLDKTGAFANKTLDKTGAFFSETN